MGGLSYGEVPIHSENDLVSARKKVRDLATELKFGVSDITRIITAASELARNILRYAGSGVMQFRQLQTGERIGLELVFTDKGPGIADIHQAMEPGYTSGGGLGMGLPGSKRLMDEMEVQSEIGQGTTVTIRKWRRDLSRERSLFTDPQLPMFLRTSEFSIFT